jgi:hypothetical protein
MSDIITKIQWARNTINDKLMFGLDDLNASLSRERRAKGVLMDCEKEINKLEQQLKEAESVIEFYSDDLSWYDTDRSLSKPRLANAIIFSDIDNNSGGKRARQYLEKYKVKQ